MKVRLGSGEAQQQVPLYLVLDLRRIEALKIQPELSGTGMNICRDALGRVQRQIQPARFPRLQVPGARHSVEMVSGQPAE